MVLGEMLEVFQGLFWEKKVEVWKGRVAKTGNKAVRNRSAQKGRVVSCAVKG